jgi:hypothetical protein
MRKGTSAVAVICATMLGIAIARAQTTMTCVQATPAQIAALFDRWNESLATHDPDKVVANYATDAVLLPTLSNVPRTDPAGMKEYFIHFVERNPRAAIDTRTIRIGCKFSLGRRDLHVSSHGQDTGHNRNGEGTVFLRL